MQNNKENNHSFIETITVKSVIYIIRFEFDISQVEYTVSVINHRQLPSFKVVKDEHLKWRIKKPVPDEAILIEPQLDALIQKNNSDKFS